MQWIKTHAIVVEERPQHFNEHLDIRDREDKDVTLLDSWLIRGCCSNFEASINEYSLLKSSKEWKAHWRNLFTKQGSSGLISSGVLGMNTSRNRRTNMITRRRTPSLELDRSWIFHLPLLLACIELDDEVLVSGLGGRTAGLDDDVLVKSPLDKWSKRWEISQPTHYLRV